MLRRGYRAKLINNCMHLSSTTELDTAKVVSFQWAQLTLTPCESRRMAMRFALRRLAKRCDSVTRILTMRRRRVILFRGQETPPTIDSQGDQLANAGNAGYLRDQLAHDRQGRNRGLDRSTRSHHQGGVVLPARARLGRHRMGTALSTANPESGTAGPLQTGGPVSRN